MECVFLISFLVAIIEIYNLSVQDKNITSMKNSARFEDVL